MTRPTRDDVTPSTIGSAAARIAGVAALVSTLLGAPALAQPHKGAPEPAANGARPVLVFAAASLQTALNAVAREWARDTGKKATFSFAASSALARQLEQGAPGDLFASADVAWMDWAQGRGLVRDGTRRTLLANSLVLVEPVQEAPTPLAITPGFPLAAAIGGSRLAMGNPQSVPAGRYAREALTSLGVWSDVAARIAGAENVRAALGLVARGEARFGVVYATDARTEPRVRVVGAFPAGSHEPIRYPFALTAGSAHPDAAAFLDYLGSPAAIRVFEAEGFTVLR
jgi:molybdate transport system substrate-binding protein